MKGEASSAPYCACRCGRAKPRQAISSVLIRKHSDMSIRKNSPSCHTGMPAAGITGIAPPNSMCSPIPPRMISASRNMPTRYQRAPTFQIKSRPRRARTPSRPAGTAVTTVAAMAGAQPVRISRNPGRGVDRTPCEYNARGIIIDQAIVNIIIYIAIKGLRLIYSLGLLFLWRCSCCGIHRLFSFPVNDFPAKFILKKQCRRV